MKTMTSIGKFLLILSLCLGFNSKAQTINTEWATKINQTFAGIDKNRVPHSLLRDYAMEFTDLSMYNGTLTDTNYVSRGKLKSIYNTLVMSRVKSTVSSLINPKIFDQNWNNLRAKNTIVLSGLYYKYSQFKANAYPSLLTVSNNKLYDKYVNGVWQNPYEIKQVFAITAPITRFKGLTVDVKLPQSLWYTNQVSAIQNIAIDFDNGNGYVTMPFNSTYNLQYTEEGIYDWTYKLTLTNGQILYSRSRIIIEKTLYDTVSTQHIMKRTINEPCATNEFGIDQVEFVGTQNYLGQTNTATIEIDYLGTNDCDDGITRPLIVAEGFDSGLLGMENGLGDEDYDGFFREATRFTGALAGEIDNYDIIYVNWDQGRDHLQRNALLLQDIIEWVNSEKTANGSSEQNVVLGQSMGGVIARYALADMEQRGLTHDTRLYISHDAPHQGANIPLGIQYFARHLADQFIGTPLGDFSFEVSNDSEASIEEINALFNEPGTRQLLSNYIAPNFSLSTTEFDAFQADLQSKGYPTQTRNIAISNGSHCANTQDYDYNASLFRMNGRARTGVLTDILGTFLGIADDIALAIIFDEPALILGVLPGSSRFDLDFNAKALPIANTSANIYKGKISYTKRLFWFINITVNLTDRSYNNPVNLSYDKYAGGRYELFRGIDPIDFFDDDNDFDGDGEPDITQFQADLLNALVGSANINFNVEQTFGFIPIPSALDVGGGATTLDDDDYFRVYNAANPPTGNLAIPFQNFITAYENNNSENEEHISFNFRNGNWLATELDTDDGNEDVFDCSFVCSDVDLIINDDIICSSSSYILSSDNIFGNINISQGQNLVNIFGAGTNTLTIVPISLNVKGLLSFSFSIGNNDCGTQTFEKVIWIGKPLDDLSMVSSGGFTLSTGNWYQLTAMHQNFDYFIHGDLTYQWQIPYAQIMFSNNNIAASVLPTQLGTYPYKLKTENICGCSDWITRHFEVLSTPGKGDLYISPTGN